MSLLAKAASLVLLPFFLILSLQHSQQLTGGTILALIATDDAIAVAADSGGTNPLQRHCKITALSSKLFFARSGRTGVGSWTTTDEARGAYRELIETKGVDFSASDLTREWGERTKRSYGQAWPVHGEDLLKGLKHNKVTIGLFGGEESGSLFLYDVTVRFERNQSDAPIFSYTVDRVALAHTAPGRAYGENGAIQGVREFYDNRTARSRRENERLRQGLGGAPQEDFEVLKLKAALEAAIKWAGDESKAARPVDALVLKKGEPIRWVSRKCECPEK